MQRKPFLTRLGFILPIGLVILLISSPTSAEDIYSVDLPDASYIEADRVPDPYFYGDEGCMDVTLPFPFTFYNKEYTHAWVSLNGYLSFTRCSSVRWNDPLSTTAVTGAIFAFWDDLDGDKTESVRTRELPAPNRRFVIEWRNAKFHNDKSKSVDFEIVLHENGVILLQYRNIDNNPLEMGGSATVGIEDETGTKAVQYGGAIGPGEYAIRFSQLARTIRVPVDIKPGACPNPFNIGSQGVLPVAILGTSDFDVTTIDPTTVTLVGGQILSEDPLKRKKKIKILVNKQHPLRWSLEDVGGTPDGPLAAKIDPYQCNNLGPDGHMDILFKFDTQAIAATLGDVEENEPITLQLHGKLRDETPIIGEDVVIIKGGKERKNR